MWHVQLVYNNVVLSSYSRLARGRSNPTARSRPPRKTTKNRTESILVLLNWTPRGPNTKWTTSNRDLCSQCRSSNLCHSFRAKHKKHVVKIWHYTLCNVQNALLQYYHVIVNCVGYNAKICEMHRSRRLFKNEGKHLGWREGVCSVDGVWTMCTSRPRDLSTELSFGHE